MRNTVNMIEKMGFNKNIKFKILTLMIFIQFINIYGQSKDSYLPIELGEELKYKWTGKESINSFIDSLFIDNKLYYMYSQKTELNNIITMIHMSNDTIYTYNEYYKKHQPKCVLIPKVGAKAGKGKIVKINHSLKTKKGKIYNNLLVVEIKSDVGQILTEYYKKGIGLIAKKLDSRMILIIDE